MELEAMPISLDTALGIHAQALALRARRAEVLAANLANADTPGYKARDLDFAGTLAGAQGGAMGLAATARRHLAGEPVTPGSGELLYRVPMQPSIDGNTVDTHTEYAEFALNALQYQASLTFLNGRIRTLTTAIRGE
jgi:flagellar basal-body rod protein FlgB